MFVAYTGYGRIATLGEEVHNPERTIPKAIIITMLATMVLYIAVAIVCIGVVGASGLEAATATQAAPLASTAQEFPFPFGNEVLSVGAITAMLGVLLNLILGLSRVLLAMGRRRDMPAVFERLDKTGATPYWAVLLVGFVIGGLVLIGDVKTTWSFSAFTVLIYYALTNLAALKLRREQRLYPRWVAGLGLVACLFLAFWVEKETWLTGLGLIFVGLLWHGVARR
jgi:APA family basic amino acid/polyamine antiporter